MISTESHILRRGFAARSMFLAALAAVIALAASLLSAPSADAQTGVSTRPVATFERVDAQGEVLSSFFYAPEPKLNLLRITMRPADRRLGSTVTYQDFGEFELFYERWNPRGALHNGAAAERWVAPDGSALGVCEANRNRCLITKTEWQTLAGQTGASDTDVMQPITVAFKVPASDAASSAEIRTNTKHISSSATRPPTSGNTNLWGSVVWARVEPDKASATALTRDGKVFDEYVFSNADGNLGGNLQMVRISIGGAGIPGFSGRTYASWGTDANAGLWISVNDGADANLELSNNLVPSTIFESDGTTALCPTTSTGGSCFLNKTRYQELAGQTGAPDSTEIAPIEIGFKVPSTLANGNAWNNDTAMLYIARFRPIGSDGNEIQGQNETRTIFTRVKAQVFRLQSAARSATGARTKHDPATPLPAGSTHSATACQGGDTGRTDCTRDLEVGESVYMAAIMLKGGQAGNGYFVRSGSSWLQYGPDHFDEIEFSYAPAASGGGDAMLVSANLCPVSIPAVPAHPYVDAPRDRTAEELRTCKWDRVFYGARFRSVDNPGGAPYWDSGTGPGVLATKAGAGTITAKYLLGGVVMAEDSVALTITAATQARLASPSDAPMITAALGQRTTDSGLALQIGYYRDRAIPEHWGWDTATRIGAPGYFGPALYGDVESVALTVPARGGTLELLGTTQRCTADRSACTLSLDKSALQAAARYGLPADEISRTLGDADPIWPVRLVFHHASPSNVEISGLLTLDGGGTHAFSYTAKASAGSGPPVAGFLPGDADDILEAGQLADLIIGYTLPDDDVWSAADSDSDGQFFVWTNEDPTDASAFRVNGAAPGTIQVLPARQSGAAWRSYSAGGTDFPINAGDYIWIGSDEPPVSYRYSAAPDFWSVTGYRNTIALSSPTRDQTTPVASPNLGAYLQITGPASWEMNGGRSLRLDRGVYNYFKCVAKNTLNGDPLDAGQEFCYVTDAAGDPPQLRVDADADADVSVIASVPMWRLAGAAPVAVDGRGLEAARNTHSAQRIDAFGTATFKVQEISQLSSITLGREPVNDIVPTSPIRIGGSAALRLALLNENGMASQLSSVSAITVTVIGGGTLDGDYCSNAASCTISASSGALFDAAAANPSVVGKIGLTYKAPAQPGEASVEATVVGTDGSTFSERLTLTISGSATEIAASGEMPRVHSSATADDDRDTIKIPISASDANGNAARMPSNASATVRGIDGAALPAGSLTSEVKCTDDARLRCNLEIVVTAAAGSPLASGAYTATVMGSGNLSTEVGFAVAGPAETVTITVPADEDLPGLAGSFTATAAVADKAGVPVADGTWVTFKTTAASSGTASAIVTRPSPSDHDDNADTAAIRRAQTKNGVADATVTIVGNGIAIFTATAGDKTANEPIDTRVSVADSAVAGPPVRFETPDESAATGTLATWTRTAAGNAREALEQISDASVVWLWNGVEWIRWGMAADGNPIPGSSATPFVILSGDRLWFAD